MSALPHTQAYDTADSACKASAFPMLHPSLSVWTMELRFVRCLTTWVTRALIDIFEFLDPSFYPNMGFWILFTLGFKNHIFLVAGLFFQLPARVFHSPCIFPKPSLLSKFDDACVSLSCVRVFQYGVYVCVRASFRSFSSWSILRLLAPWAERSKGRTHAHKHTHRIGTRARTIMKHTHHQILKASSASKIYTENETHGEWNTRKGNWENRPAKYVKPNVNWIQKHKYIWIGARAQEFK